MFIKSKVYIMSEELGENKQKSKEFTEMRLM